VLAVVGTRSFGLSPFSRCRPSFSHHVPTFRPIISLTFGRYTDLTFGQLLPRLGRFDHYFS
jgi:hypothetical protein